MFKSYLSSRPKGVIVILGEGWGYDSSFGWSHVDVQSRFNATITGAGARTENGMMGYYPRYTRYYGRADPPWTIPWITGTGKK